MNTKREKARLAGLCVVLAAFILIPASQAGAAADTTQFGVTAGSLSLSTAPDVPDFSPGLTLDGTAQTLNEDMDQSTSWQVADATGSGSGWNVNVVGDTAGGKSEVFAEYCPTNTDGPCLTNGVGYVTSGETLSANSLTLDSDMGSPASFSAVGGTTGTAPTHSCGSTCNADSASSVIIGTAAADAGMGTYQSTGYETNSIALSAPTTIKVLDDTEKVYRVDLVWTLASGPS